MLVLLVFIQVLYVCMIYGPIAAYLVEAFPAKIRYTSLSLPYHIGNGVFGGLLPLIGLVGVRGDREYLRRAVLPDDRGGDHARLRQPAAERDARHEDLGRGGRNAVTMLSSFVAPDAFRVDLVAPASA